MPESQIIAMTLSLILGLSVAQMLSATALAFRARRESPLAFAYQESTFIP